MKFTLHTLFALAALMPVIIAEIPVKLKIPMKLSIVTDRTAGTASIQGGEDIDLADISDFIALEARGTVKFYGVIHEFSIDVVDKDAFTSFTSDTPDDDEYKGAKFQVSPELQNTAAVC
jgi:hypothetical protein